MPPSRMPTFRLALLVAVGAAALASCQSSQTAGDGTGGAVGGGGAGDHGGGFGRATPGALAPGATGRRQRDRWQRRRRWRWRIGGRRPCRASRRRVAQRAVARAKTGEPTTRPSAGGASGAGGGASRRRRRRPHGGAGAGRVRAAQAVLLGARNLRGLHVRRERRQHLEFGRRAREPAHHEAVRRRPERHLPRQVARRRRGRTVLVRGRNVGPDQQDLLHGRFADHPHAARRRRTATSAPGRAPARSTRRRRTARTRSRSPSRPRSRRPTTATTGSTSSRWPSRRRSRATS